MSLIDPTRFDPVWALRLVDALLVFMLMEALALMAWRRWSRRPPAMADYSWSLLAGAGLMAALHCALAEAPLGALAACLCAAGLAHAMDWSHRWRQGRRHLR